MGSNFFKKISKGSNNFFKKVGNGADSVFKKVGSGLNQAGSVITKGLDTVGSVLEKNSGYLEDVAGGLAAITGNEEFAVPLLAAGQSGLVAQKALRRKVGNTINQGNSLIRQAQNQSANTLGGLQNTVNDRINIGQRASGGSVNFQ